MDTENTSNKRLALGAIVRNFGLVATVTAFHPVTGDPILRDSDGLQWVADAAKCERIQTACRHKNGLVVFD